jgi:tubulin alpha
MSVHSTGGGSGSGYNSLILEQVKEEFPKTLTIECSLSPSGVFSTNMVEPYNSLMAAHYTMPTVDVCFLFDNDALYHLCTQKIGIRNPSYNHLNRLTSQIYSSMTACMRFGGCLASNLSDYQTNLVPYPRIRFPVTSYAPLSSPDRSAHEPRILDNMTKDVFKRTSMLCTCNTDKGKFVSCCLMYRGDVNPAEVYGCIAKLKSFGRIQFVDWCPTGMKLSVCQTSPVIVPSSFIAPSSRNVMLMSNSSAIGEIFQRIATRYELLFKKRSFVHWFVGEGMEEGEFNDAIIDLQTLVVDYNQCCDLTSPDNDEEDLMKCIQQAQMETSQDNPILSSPPVAEFSDDSKRDEPEMTDEEPN